MSPRKSTFAATYNRKNKDNSPLRASYDMAMRQMDSLDEYAKHIALQKTQKKMRDPLI